MTQCWKLQRVNICRAADLLTLMKLQRTQVCFCTVNVSQLGQSNQTKLQTVDQMAKILLCTTQKNIHVVQFQLFGLQTGLNNINYIESATNKTYQVTKPPNTRTQFLFIMLKIFPLYVNNILKHLLMAFNHFQLKGGNMIN